MSDGPFILRVHGLVMDIGIPSPAFQKHGGVDEKDICLHVSWQRRRDVVCSSSMGQ